MNDIRIAVAQYFFNSLAPKKIFQIRQWMSSDSLLQSRRCPFRTREPVSEETCLICKNLFHYSHQACPCCFFSIEFVVETIGLLMSERKKYEKANSQKNPND